MADAAGLAAPFVALSVLFGATFALLRFRAGR
jgi:hypothetical protein